MPIFFTNFDENYSLYERYVLGRVGVLKCLFIVFTTEISRLKQTSVSPATQKHRYGFHHIVCDDRRQVNFISFHRS